jgi:hypothetical protein
MNGVFTTVAEEGSTGFSDFEELSSGGALVGLPSGCVEAPVAELGTRADPVVCILGGVKASAARENRS